MGLLAELWKWSCQFIEIWTMVKDRDCFREESSHSRISREAEWEKHGIKNGLEDDNFDLCRGHDVSKAIILN